MDKRFRALRLVASLNKIFAWILLLVGILSAALLVVLTVVQDYVGVPSPVLQNVPVLSLTRDLLSGILLAVGVVVLSLAQFLFFYARSDSIHVALSVERSAREAALYLRGESLLAPIAQPVAWNAVPEGAPERN